MSENELRSYAVTLKSGSVVYIWAEQVLNDGTGALFFYVGDELVFLMGTGTWKFVTYLPEDDVVASVLATGGDLVNEPEGFRERLK